MKLDKKNKSNTTKIAFYSTISLIVLGFIYLFMGDTGSTIGVDEMLRHVHTGEVPF